MTEVLNITYASPATLAADPESVGRPFSAAQVYMIGGDGERLPPGEAGEIVVSSPALAAGYWNRPELTRQAFRRSPVGVSQYACSP